MNQVHAPAGCQNIVKGLRRQSFYIVMLVHTISYPISEVFTFTNSLSLQPLDVINYI